MNSAFIDNFYILSDSITNGYRPEILDIISFLSILNGILVIIIKNPVVSVLFLIGLFVCISCFLIILGMNFIGLSYLLVYVGAISILFLFILMLINVRISELLNDTSNSIILAILVTILFSFPIYNILPYNTTIYKDNIDFFGTYNNIYLYCVELFSPYIYKENNPHISFVSSKIWDSSLIDITHITSIGNIMYTSYSIWLILTSIILLLAMVGAIVITIKQND